MTEKPRPESRQQSLRRLEVRHALGLVADHEERETRINSLPPVERELAKESARFGDLCQFFGQKRIDVPQEVIEQLTRVATLPAAERVAVMKKLNQSLMECLHDVDQGTGIRL